MLHNQKQIKMTDEEARNELRQTQQLLNFIDSGEMQFGELIILRVKKWENLLIKHLNK